MFVANENPSRCHITPGRPVLFSLSLALLPVTYMVEGAREGFANGHGLTREHMKDHKEVFAVTLLCIVPVPESFHPGARPGRWAGLYSTIIAAQILFC